MAKNKEIEIFQVITFKNNSLSFIFIKSQLFFHVNTLEFYNPKYFSSLFTLIISMAENRINPKSIANILLADDKDKDVSKQVQSISNTADDHSDRVHFLVKCCLQGLLKISKLMLILSQVKLKGKNNYPTYFQ